ncbi:XRE family transcriptional regulator [Hyphomonas oceanitis]|uniref:XRE family transcriptional regulator n=1 Tax=Hyphomonas oceanitis SCH89 TaxID=1280953 RepID=A0A059GB17_9PROT|nr:XRE family transcriptional regulator [Hyphomonas oceanitis]KDA03770.1 XRE family transcriptional regulator [Hyphomonas oceanitis SCH89]
MSFKADAAKIKRWREERYWSQEHVADLAGIGLRTIQRIENGEPASQESLKALAAAYNVDVIALSVDQAAEAANTVARRNAKTRAAIRLSLWIHLAGYAIGVVVFVGISIGIGGNTFVMKWPLIWWTVGFVSHIATVLIVHVATRYQEQVETGV